MRAYGQTTLSGVARNIYPWNLSCTHMQRAICMHMQSCIFIISRVTAYRTWLWRPHHSSSTCDCSLLRSSHYSTQPPAREGTSQLSTARTGMSWFPHSGRCSYHCKLPLQVVIAGVRNICMQSAQVIINPRAITLYIAWAGQSCRNVCFFIWCTAN